MNLYDKKLIGARIKAQYVSTDKACNTEYRIQTTEFPVIQLQQVDRLYNVL